MEACEWQREIEIDGRKYVAHFVKRPFREGLEVYVDLAERGLIRFAELGLGEQALMERVRSVIAEKRSDTTN